MDAKYATNAAALDSLAMLLDEATSPSAEINLHRIYLSGASSPDGNLNANLALARRRMLAIRNYLTDGMGINPSTITLGNVMIPWEEFRQYLSSTGSQQLLEIASAGSDGNPADVQRRMYRLKKIDNGKLWRQLATDVFPHLRRAVMLTIVTTPAPVAEIIEQVDTIVETPSIPVVVPDTVPAQPSPVVPDTVLSATPSCTRSWHISTSALAWGAAIANATAEYDFACHWSTALSIYYSAWNYGKTTRKFRTFIFRPEVRYWLGDEHKGLFFDAHIQMASYNFALPSWEYRIQDRKGKHPALGGGLGVGYRLPISRNGRWAAEAAIGAGVYHLDYDRFDNRPNGQWVDRCKRTFFGIDNVAISIVYNFNPINR